MRNAGVVLLLLAAGCFQSGHEPPRQAIELNNQAYQAFLKGDHEQALQLVENAIQLDRRFTGAYANKAAILEKQGKRAEAVAALEMLVKLNPSGGDGYLAMGVLLEKMGRKPEAEKHYARALKLFTEQAARAAAEEKPNADINKAAAQYLAGDTPGSAATLDAVLAADPKNEKARAYRERVNSGQRDVFLNGAQ